MPNPPFSWTCTYCGQPTTITDINFDIDTINFNLRNSKNPEFALIAEAISCPNPDCEEVTLTANFWENNWVKYSGGQTYWQPDNLLNEWKLLPRSSAKPMPEYIPEEIRNNYLEACLIQSDSPKASAAMSRRCLQGIVRDFWSVPVAKRGNLGAEISYIQNQIDEDTYESIKAVREVGDIGAHMEKSVDTIVDVEPEEAALLIELIETLISDWYVAKHRRANRNKALQQTVAAKRSAKKVAKDSLKQIEKKFD